MIDAIKFHIGDSIAFICTNIRASNINPNSSVSETAFKQLHKTVKALCKGVETLTTQTKTILDQILTSNQVNFSDYLSDSRFFELVREDCREIKKRRIHKKCIVIKRIKATSVESLTSIFNHASIALLN